MATVLLTATILAAVWLVWPVPAVSDAGNYWLLNMADPYRNRFGEAEAFLYSPIVAQVIYPFTLLPLEAFYKLLLAVNLVALAWLLGPWAVPALLLPPIHHELQTGNIHLLLAVMVAVGFRYSGAWAFGILTKGTPGVGLVWFAARREWKPLAWAVAWTVGSVALSALTVPNLWVEWVEMLAESPLKVEQNYAVNEWPVVLRLPIAAALMVMAAWRGRILAVPWIVCFALPAIWVGSLALMAAIPRLRTRTASRQPKGCTADR